MDLQTFFDSIIGQISVVAVIIVLFGVILYSGKGKPVDTKAVAISAVLVALSIILNQLVLFRMPQGGSITAFSMVPIVLCAYFFTSSSVGRLLTAPSRFNSTRLKNEV